MPLKSLPFTLMGPCSPWMMIFAGMTGSPVSHSEPLMGGNAPATPFPSGPWHAMQVRSKTALPRAWMSVIDGELADDFGSSGSGLEGSEAGDGRVARIGDRRFSRGKHHPTMRCQSLRRSRRRGSGRRFRFSPPVVKSISTRVQSVVPLTALVWPPPWTFIMQPRRSPASTSLVLIQPERSVGGVGLDGDGDGGSAIGVVRWR